MLHLQIRLPSNASRKPHHHGNQPLPALLQEKNIFSPSEKHRNNAISIITRRRSSTTIHNNLAPSSDKNKFHTPQAAPQESSRQKNFMGAVSLIIGTAIGPGMLGLPAATIQSGPLPSSIAILISWIYVISSVILVAELSYAAMEEEGVEEVSFTGLAIKAFGSRFGAVVALIYASLTFSLLVACVSGIGSIVKQWLPWINHVLANALFPFAIGLVIVFFPFKAIDGANRLLCFVMLIAMAVLVTIGISVARENILVSFTKTASWSLSSILPAIPVTVLTLGFHVITPFICKIAGNSVHEARKAILLGGAVPLVTVLLWNLIVLGLSGADTAPHLKDPMSLLLSVNRSALFAVQLFAFSALATSLIGYAVSFPKQLVDTSDLIFGTLIGLEEKNCSRSNGDGEGKHASNNLSSRDKKSNMNGLESSNVVILLVVLAFPILLATFFHSTFSRALEFAGIYANCFLFGILPPAMTYIYKFRNKARSSFLPGGDCTLVVLFITAVILGVWH